MGGDRLQPGDRLGPRRGRIGLADAGNDHDDQRDAGGPALRGERAERRVVELPVVRAAAWP